MHVSMYNYERVVSNCVVISNHPHFSEDAPAQSQHGHLSNIIWIFWKPHEQIIIGIIDLPVK